MTGKADFTEEEWTRLKRAPFVAGMAISLSDPGGPIELVKETAATLKTVVGAAEQGDRGELVGAVADRGRRRGQGAQEPAAATSSPRARWPARRSSRSSPRSTRIVSAKASPEDAEAYRAWLRDAAQEAANAAKEGGFFGFHAVRVSEGEQRMLDKLDEALAPPA